MALDKPRFLENFLHRQNRRVKTLHVTHLDHQPEPLSQFKQLPGLGYRDGERFFHQEVAALAQEPSGHFEVLIGGNHHADRLRTGGEVIEVVESTGMVLLGLFFRPGAPGIHQPHQFHVLQFGVDPGVTGTEVAHTDNRNFDFIH